MSPRFLVKEREFLGLSPVPQAYRGGRHARIFSAWKTIGHCATFEEARVLRSARSTGLFHRVVFYRGALIIASNGQQLRCTPGWHVCLRAATCNLVATDRKASVCP